MPGSVRTASATDISLRRASSSASMTSTAFAVSCTVSGVLDAVTTTSAVTPVTPSVRSLLLVPSTRITVAPDNAPAAPRASST